MINPEYLDTLIAFEQSNMVAAGMHDADISAHVNQLHTMYSLPVQPIFQGVFGILYGVVFALIFSAIFKRNQPNLPKLSYFAGVRYWCQEFPPDTNMVSVRM